MNRRGFLGALAGLFVAPAVAKAIPSPAYRGLQVPPLNFYRDAFVYPPLSMKEIERLYLHPAMDALAADIDAHVLRAFEKHKLPVRFDPARLPA